MNDIAQPIMDNQRANTIRGLLWREWLANGQTLQVFLALWLLGGWVLMIFSHPGWIIGFGCLFAVVCAPVFAGMDVLNGAEEFEFSLPPTRGERYLVRLALSGGILLFFVVVGTLAIAADLPQLPWRIVVNSGFTEPFPEEPRRFLYALAISTPLCLFAFIFAFASTGINRAMFAGSIALGLFGTVLVLVGGFGCENLIWEEINGYISIPAQLALGAGALLGGYTTYVRKEGIGGPTVPLGTRRWGVVTGVALAGFVAFLLIGIFVSVDAPKKHSEEADRRRQEAIAEREAEQRASRASVEPATTNKTVNPEKKTKP